MELEKTLGLQQDEINKIEDARKKRKWTSISEMEQDLPDPIFKKIRDNVVFG